MRGCLVTGTDTGVGKTVLAAAIIASLRRRGCAVRAFKPVLTGLDEPPDPVWPRDHELLALAAGGDPDQVALMRYGPPVSPHLAAELAGRPIALSELAAAVRRSAGGGREAAAVEAGSAAREVPVVEGVGGLLVPLGDGATVRDLAVALGLPVLVAARPGLGTINHTLLTLEAARHAGLSVAAVVLTPWPPRPGLVERSNRETIGVWGGVEVGVLPTVASPDAEALAEAAAPLPLERWLA